MNYSELVQAIQDYTQNEETSFVSNIPTFVQQAEERINRSIMLPELRKNATATMTAGNKYVARPSDFLSVFSFAVIDAAGDTTYLLGKDVSFIREAYPSSGTQAIPKYYAQFDGDYDTDEGNFILGPTPDASYASNYAGTFDSSRYNNCSARNCSGSNLPSARNSTGGYVRSGRNCSSSNLPCTYYTRYRYIRACRNRDGPSVTRCAFYSRIATPDTAAPRRSRVIPPPIYDNDICH